MPHLENKYPCVLMLTTDRQIDRRTLQQAESLEKAGLTVVILAMPQETLSQKDHPLVLRVSRPFLTMRFNPISIWSWYRKIRTYLPMNGFLNQVLRGAIWSYLVNPEKLYSELFAQALAEYTPKVLMAIDLPMLAVAAKKANLVGAKLVYDSHELYSEQAFSRHEKRMWQNLEKKFIHQCDEIITVNSSIASELEQRYGIKKIHVIYNAVDANSQGAKKKWFHESFKLPLATKVLLFQGGLSKGRNLETLIKAMKYVKNEQIVLVILGNGRLRKKLEQLMCSLSLKHKVYFHEAVSQEQLLDYTQAADAGIIPYQANCLNNYYCTPNKLFEFIAAGIPILGSDLPEIKAIVVKHQLGLVGDMRSAHKLSELIDKLFHKEEQLALWRKNTIVAKQEFSWQGEEKKFLQIFRDIT